jgi:hypothetical protein
MAMAAQFEAVLKQRIAEERESAVEDLAKGGPEDYAAYRQTVGFIRALDQIDEWCADVTRKLDER